MYSVSAAYLAALALPVHKYRLTGTVGTEAFNEANIVSGSLSVSNKVSEGSEIKLGSVYTGELKGKFTGMSIARGAWVGKTITLSEGLLIDADNDTYEDVPLGIFTVAEANHTAEGVEVTAYDAMTNFDKTRNDLTDTGTAYAFLTLMCQKCGVTLGSTLADIQALPNGTETFSIYAENDIETWRDLLSWIAQTLGAVATIGRDGKLYLRQYSMTAAATIDETHRFTGCSFSDFVTYYTGMSVVDIALRQTEYKSEVVDDGLTYNLGSNPLVQGHYEYVQEIIDDFSNVALTPFNAQMLGGAIYDLCDCLTFSGGIAAGATCGVMGYTWKYNGAYSVKGFGANPALATAKSKTQKELEALYNTVGQDINEMSVVQNSTAVTIAENTETSILTYNFEVTEEENTTMVDVSVVMTATATETLVGEVYTLADLVAQLRFYVDNSQVTVYDPTFIVDEGKDTMTFNFSLSGLSVGAHEFDVRLTVGGGSGSIAVGDVHEMLWGYGITFEVYLKNVLLRSLPYNTVYMLNSNIDYTGLEIVGAYNNGTTQDITADCEITPADGTYTEHSGAFEVVGTYVDGENEYEVSFDALVVSGCFFDQDTFTPQALSVGVDVLSSDGTVTRANGRQVIPNDHEFYYLYTSGSNAKKFCFVRNGLESQFYTLTKADGTLVSLGHCGIPGGFVYETKLEPYKYRLVKVIGDYELGVISEEILLEITRTDGDYGFFNGTFQQYGKYGGNILVGRGNNRVPLPNGDIARSYAYIDVQTGEFSDTNIIMNSWGDLLQMEDGSFYALWPVKMDSYPDPTPLLVYLHVHHPDGTDRYIDMTSDFGFTVYDNTGAGTGILRYDEANDCIVAYVVNRDTDSRHVKETKGFKLDMSGDIIEEINVPNYIEVPYATGLTDATKARIILNGSTDTRGVVGDTNYVVYWDTQRYCGTRAQYFNAEGKNAPMKRILIDIPTVPASYNDRVVCIESVYLEDNANSIVRATV